MAASKIRNGVLLAAALIGLSLDQAPAQQDGGATPLDLTGFRQTFIEEFDRLDVSAWGPNSRWIAHTPWNGDFGDAAFANPGDGFPFTIDKGELRIEMRRGSDGKWRSGLLASVDAAGNGFSQQYGYFEIRTRLPRGKGVWPSFWLIGVNRVRDKQYTAEIDVFEHQGHHPSRFTSAIHAVDRLNRKSLAEGWNRTQVDGTILSDRFNTFGVLVDAEQIRFYFNRREVWQYPTPEIHRQPMFLLLNLGLGSGFRIDETPSPSFMHVDYVKAWSLPAR